MDYYNHYRIDNNNIDYDAISDYQKNLIKYRFRLIAYYLNKYDINNILDIGSGNGNLYEYTNKNYFSMDISQINNRTNAKKIEGDIYHIPIKTNLFDAVIISEILEHIEDIDKALQQVNRILKEKKYLILTVPYKEKIKYHLCVHCNQLTPENAHLHSFNKKKLTDILEKNNFHIIEFFLFENKLLSILHFFSIFKNMPLNNIKNIDSIAKSIKNKYNKLLLIAYKK